MFDTNYSLKKLECCVFCNNKQKVNSYYETTACDRCQIHMVLDDQSDLGVFAYKIYSITYSISERDNVHTYISKTKNSTLLIEHDIRKGKDHKSMTLDMNAKECLVYAQKCRILG